MAVAFVKKGTRAAFAGGSSAAPSLASVGAGNLVVLAVAASRGDTAATAIAAPSGWTAAQNPAGPSIAGSPNYTPVVGIFYKLSSAGGTESATVSVVAGSYGWAQISEYSGGPFTFTGAQSAHAEFNTGATSRATGTTGANSIADAVSIAVGHPEDTIGATSALGTPAGWTSLDLEPSNAAENAWSADYKILSATGTQSATHSWTTNSYYAGAVAIFEGPAGATSYNLTVDSASYSLTAAAETVTATRALTISPASYALTAQAVTLAVGRALNISPASYALSAAAVTMAVGRVLNVSPASYALTATDVTLTYAPSLKELVVDPASYAVSAADVSFAVTRALSIDPASYSLTNSAETLSVGRVLSVDPSSYALSASAQTLAVGRVLAVDPVAYALTLADVTLDYRPSNPVLSVDPVSYVLSLADVELEYGRAGGGGYDSKAKVRRRVNELNKKILQAEAIEEAQEITQVAVTKAKSVKKSADQGFDEDEDEALMLLL